MSGPSDVVSEFAAALRDAGGPHQFAQQMAEMRGWAAAFNAAVEAVDLIPPDTEHTVHRFAAATVARAVFKAMQAQGIEVPWPLRLDGMLSR